MTFPFTCPRRVDPQRAVLWMIVTLRSPLVGSPASSARAGRWSRGRDIRMVHKNQFEALGEAIDNLEQDENWERIEVTVDSGASETVVPEDMILSAEIVDGPADWHAGEGRALTRRSTLGELFGAADWTQVSDAAAKKRVTVEDAAQADRIFSRPRSSSAPSPTSSAGTTGSADAFHRLETR